jgi:hypothetical protein
LNALMAFNGSLSCDPLAKWIGNFVQCVRYEHSSSPEARLSSQQPHSAWS